MTSGGFTGKGLTYIGIDLDKTLRDATTAHLALYNRISGQTKTVFWLNLFVIGVTHAVVIAAFGLRKMVGYGNDSLNSRHKPGLGKFHALRAVKSESTRSGRQDTPRIGFRLGFDFPVWTPKPPGQGSVSDSKTLTRAGKWQ